MFVAILLPVGHGAFTTSKPTTSSRPRAQPSRATPTKASATVIQKRARSLPGNWRSVRGQRWMAATSSSTRLHRGGAGQELQFARIFSFAEGPTPRCRKLWLKEFRFPLPDGEIVHVDERIAELMALKKQLVSLRRQCGRKARVANCRILSGISHMQPAARGRGSHL